MFVRNIDDITGTDEEPQLTEGGRVLRFRHVLTRDDGCGFSVSDVHIEGGWSSERHYKHHVAVNYLAAGQAEVLDLTSARSWDLSPGMLYVVGPNDRHRLSTRSDTHLISILNPAITGAEQLDGDGALEPTGEVPAAWAGEAGRTMFVLQDESARNVVLRDGRVRTSRYLTAEDGCGITVSLPRGTADSTIWYKHHVEANYVLEGAATVGDFATGEHWELGPGSLYVVGPRDRHWLRAEREVRVMSIFNPPLKGDETHNDEGSYPPSGEIPVAWRAP